MLKVLIHKNIYFTTLLIVNILFLLLGTQQELVFLSYFVVVSQLTRQCAEGLIQPRVLNNINTSEDKTIIYTSELFVIFAFACGTALIFAYSLKLNIQTFLSTIPIIIIVISLQPALSDLNRQGNFMKWNKILLIPELLSFLIFIVAHQFEVKSAIHIKFLSQSGLLIFMKVLLKVPSPIIEWQSPDQVKDIRVSVITNLLSKNIDKYVAGIVLMATDFMLYERVIYFLKALINVFFLPLNIWVQNRSRKLTHKYIKLFLKNFMTWSMLVSFAISVLLITLFLEISFNLSEISEELLRYFFILLPVFIMSAPVSCTSGFLYALGKVQIVRDMTLAHFSYSVVLYTVAIFWIRDVESALIVLLASYVINYVMVVFFLLKTAVININFAVKHTVITIACMGILFWIN